MCLTKKLTHLFERLEYYGWPVLLVGIRFWMAFTFGRTAIVKVKHLDATLSLFRFEYHIPFISPDIAAYMTMFFELACPALLILGLMTRLATIPLLVIVGVIHFTYITHHDHMDWILMLGVLLLKGAGPLSLDALWCRRYVTR